MTPRQFAGRVDRVVRLLQQNRAAAWKAVAQVAYAEAQHLSSGTLSYSDLAAMDYPYARRHGGSKVPGDPAIVNAHRGVFRAGWRYIVGPNGCALINSTQEALWLNRGTSLMIPRPFDERIRERTEHQALVLLVNSTRRSLRPIL